MFPKKSKKITEFKRHSGLAINSAKSGSFYKKLDAEKKGRHYIKSLTGEFISKPSSKKTDKIREQVIEYYKKYSEDTKLPSFKFSNEKSYARLEAESFFWNARLSEFSCKYVCIIKDEQPNEQKKKNYESVKTNIEGKLSKEEKESLEHYKRDYLLWREAVGYLAVDETYEDKFKNEFDESDYKFFTKEINPKQEDKRRLWYLAYKLMKGFEEALSEVIGGEILRYVLGSQQPKARLIISEENRSNFPELFIGSREVLHKAFFQDIVFTHDSYLQHYAAGLVANLWCRNNDLHFQQILVTENDETIFIDLGDAFLSKRRIDKKNKVQKYRAGYCGDIPMKIVTRFNSHDVHDLPQVGRNASSHRGEYHVTNWLFSFIHKGDGIIKSTPQKNTLDTNTNRNPRFQADKHRALFKIFITPEALLDDVIAKAIHQIPEKYRTLKFIKNTTERIKKELLEGKSVFRKAIKEEPALYFLQNLTVYDLVEVSRETQDFINNNKRYKLKSIYGENLESIFEYIWKETLSLLEDNELSLQLRYFKSLAGEDRTQFIKGAMYGDYSAHDFYRNLSKKPILFMLAFSCLDHMSKKGSLPTNFNSERVEQPVGLDKTFQSDVSDRLKSIAQISKTKKLVKQVLEHFDIQLFENTIKYLTYPHVDSPIIPEDKPTFENTKQFLLTYQRTLKKIVMYYLDQTDDYSQQAISHNILNLIEQHRKQKIASLTSAEYDQLSGYLLPEKNKEFSSDFLKKIGGLDLTSHRNAPVIYAKNDFLIKAFWFAERNPNKTDIQQIAMELCGELNQVSFLEYYRESKSQLSFGELLSLIEENCYQIGTVTDWLIHLAYSPDTVRLLNKDISEFYVYLFKHQILTGKTLDNFITGCFERLILHCPNPSEKEALELLRDKVGKYLSDGINRILPDIKTEETEAENTAIDLYQFLGANKFREKKLRYNSNDILKFLCIMLSNKSEDKLARLTHGFVNLIFYPGCVIYKDLEYPETTLLWIKYYVLKGDRLERSVKTCFKKNTENKTLIDAISTHFREAINKFLDAIPIPVNYKIFEKEKEKFGGRDFLEIFDGLNFTKQQKEFLKITHNLTLNEKMPDRYKPLLDMFKTSFIDKDTTALLHDFNSLINEEDNDECYYNLILRFFNMGTKEESLNLINAEYISDTVREQFYIIYNLIHCSVIATNEYTQLRDALNEFKIYKDSAEFIFDIIECIEEFKKDKKDLIHENCQQIIASLLYALPYRKQSINRMTSRREGEDIKLLATDLRRSYNNASHVKKAEKGLASKSVTDEQKSKLTSRLENEIVRQNTIEDVDDNHIQTINRRVAALLATKNALEQNTKFSWFTVDLLLRQLVRNKDINTHRDGWKNNWASLFTTSSRKEVDAIFDDTVATIRDATLST